MSFATLPLLPEGKLPCNCSKRTARQNSQTPPLLLCVSVPASCESLLAGIGADEDGAQGLSGQRPEASKHGK